MPNYKYVIVGGGVAGFAAIQGIRSVDSEGSIALIGSESDPPYDRPPLSKKLWTSEKDVEDIVKAVPQDVDFFPNRHVVSFSTARNELVDDDGLVYSFEKLLLATGGTPRKLPFDHEEKILYFRTLDDYRRLRELSERYETFAVIGGGFIGSELAAALRMHGRDVTMVFPEDAICARIFPSDLADYVTGHYREKGVTVVTNTNATGLHGTEGEYTLRFDDGRSEEFEIIVAGIGIVPNTEIAEATYLQVDNGILVNRQLQSSAPNVYAAGDVANFQDFVVGERRRVEHEDNALSMGEAAGRSMAGADIKYDHSPMFYSDLFDLGYEAVGILDSRLDTYSDWQDEFEKGVIYYMDDGRLRGVLLWNVWDKVATARELIAQDKTWEPEELKGQIA